MRLPVFRWDDSRPATARGRRLVLQALALLGLPPSVRRFYLRALWTAWRRHDQYSFDVVTRPHDLRLILGLAGDAAEVVEVGTATAWTTIALALGGETRQVMSFDPVRREERELYLGLVPAEVRRRISFIHGPGRTGPRPGQRVDFMFIDGSHEREDTILTFKVWAEAIRPGGAIVFHDYRDPKNPGVTDAIEALALPGRQVARLFVWARG